MALTDKLTAIGNAIRARTGGSSLLSLTDMPTAIAGIQDEPHGVLKGIERQITTQTTNTVYTISFPSSFEYVPNYNRNWVVFFPILTASNTYGVGVASNSGAFGASLYTSGSGSSAVYHKTAKIISPQGQSPSWVGIPTTWTEVVSNINITDDANGITITNTSSSTYPRATSGTAYVLYYDNGADY